jgi:CheY-like chemotaxis protein
MPNKILIVEDDPINVKFMKVVLIRKGGFEVAVSEDVAEIIQLAAAGDLAAIIMDISLSRTLYEGKKVDGIFITRLLKADPATAGIPVILATAHAMTGDRERFMAETGAEHYLAKPIHDPDAFLEQVRKAIPVQG